MKYRKLGMTDLDVSVLSYGAAALGGVFAEIDEKTGIEAVFAALKYGINYIDVSPAYGNKKAETVLGKALKTFNRDQYYLSTKVGKFCTKGEYGDHFFDYSEKAIRDSVTGSLKRLGCDYLDIVFLHDIEYNDRKHISQALGEGLETLKKLKKEGILGHYGLSTYPMDLWHNVVENSDVEVIMTHSHYCLSDDLLTEIIEPCEKRGIGIINSSPLLMGVLTSRGPASWFPATEEEKSAVKKAAAFCLENGTTIEKLAIQFSISNEKFATTLTSSSNPKRIVESIKNAMEGECDMSLVGAVQEILQPIMNRDWNFSGTCG